MQKVVIISKNSDFSVTLAEAVSRELGFPTEVTDSANKISAALAVTTEPLPKLSVPVISVAEKDKPLKLNSLLAEIQQAIGQKNDTVKLGHEYVFSAQQKKITNTSSEKTANLTDKEAQLIALLAPGKIITKEALLKTIWGVSSELESHTLETHMYRLRAKLKHIGLKDALPAVEGGYILEKK